MLSIRCVSTLEEFEGLREPWNDLVRRTSAGHLFLTWEWMYAWTKHYLSFHRLFILLVVEAGRLVGIAPLYVKKFSENGPIRVRQLGFLGTEEVGSLYLDFIIPDEKKAAVIPAIMSYLRRDAAAAWDVMILRDVPAESVSVDYLYRWVGDVGQVVEIADHTCSPVIRLGATLDQFLAAIGNNQRYNLRRKRRRLETAGRVEFERVTSPEPAGEGLDRVIALHQTRWERKGDPGCFRRPRFLAFHREVAHLFSRLGWLRLDFLRLDGETIAAIYGFSYNGRYSFYLPGFDPTACPEGSPGIVLLFETIRRSLEEGCTEVDLLRGASDYKLAWANMIRRSLTITYYNRRVRGAVLLIANAAKDGMKVLLR